MIMDSKLPVFTQERELLVIIIDLFKHQDNLQ